MSTRCALIIRTKDVTWVGRNRPKEVLRLYRHFDGYPEGMGADIARACHNADFYWRDKSNRNWGQAFLAYMMACGADLEIEPPDYEHGDIEYLYLVEGIRDLSGGLQPISEYGILIRVYECGFDESYEKVMGREPIFAGGWRSMMKWLGMEEPATQLACGAMLVKDDDGTESLFLDGLKGRAKVKLDKGTGLDEIALAIEKVCG